MLRCLTVILKADYLRTNSSYWALRGFYLKESSVMDTTMLKESSVTDVTMLKESSVTDVTMLKESSVTDLKVKLGHNQNLQPCLHLDAYIRCKDVFTLDVKTCKKHSVAPHASLCTSLMLLKIPMCLYNSTMHSDTILIVSMGCVICC